MTPETSQPALESLLVVLQSKKQFPQPSTRESGSETKTESRLDPETVSSFSKNVLEIQASMYF